MGLSKIMPIQSRRNRNHLATSTALLLLMAMFGCGQTAPDQPLANKNDNSAEPAATGASSTQQEPEKIASELLPNAYRLHEKVISGGQPEGDAAFAELAALGVKTVISVDGATPDVDAAKAHGLRYVHLPHGYDGISEQRVQELAKAVRDLPGPIYIHCHHGKHRSPAAATAACVAVGFLQPQQALAVLQTAGTSPNYQGLYDSAESARKLDEALLDALEVEFQETVAIPPMADAMVHIEHTQDHLKMLSAAGWKPTEEHPDLDPPHEALLMREHFTELLRTEEVQQQAEQFRVWLEESETAASELEAILRDTVRPHDEVVTLANEALQRISTNCSNCHKQFRDVPLKDK